MSQEILQSLNQAAIARMSPYELVERAVALQSHQNLLNINPMPGEDGSTFHTVASDLVAGSELLTELRIEDSELVHYQTMRSPATLLAHVVELRPPGHGSEKGDATLFRIQESLTLPLAQARAPFRPTALQAVNGEPGVKGLSAIRFDGVCNTLYKSFPFAEEGADYLSQAVGNDLPVLATDKSHIHLTEIGKDTLDNEVGVLATVSGLAQIALEKQHFVRITDNGVFYGPAEAQTLTVDIPPDTPQHHKANHYRIPDTAIVGVDKDGLLVPQGSRAKDSKYSSVTLNPLLDPTEALAIIGREAIDWTEGTDAFLNSIKSTMGALLPLNVRTSYAQARQLAQDKLREVLASRQPQIGDIGCLAVAAHVSEMSLPSGSRRVNPTFFRGKR